MKRALGILLLLVLVLGLVSLPAFAEKAELNLKYWHAGIGGADLWVADCEEYEVLYVEGEDPYDYYYPGDLLASEKLVLRFGTGTSFILSGSYLISPSVSLDVSYWSLSRSDKVSKALDYPGEKLEGEFVDDEDDTYIGEWSDSYYRIRLPWSYETEGFWSWYWKWLWSDDTCQEESYEGVIIGQGDFSMSALDISGTKDLTGFGWEVGLSGGIRKASFDQSQLVGLKTFYEWWDEDPPYYDYSLSEGEKGSVYLDSTLSLSAIGPQVGFEGTYALADKLVLKAGAKAGLLFGTAKTHAEITHDPWEYYWDGEEEVFVGWVPVEGAYFKKEYPSTTDTIRFSTYDLSVDLAYQITEQWSVEAGYYASIWSGVPSLVEVSVDADHFITWKKPEARTVTVSGLTIGANFKF